MPASRPAEWLSTPLARQLVMAEKLNLDAEEFFKSWEDEYGQSAIALQWRGARQLVNRVTA